MNRNVALALFGLLVIAQLGVPISMILGSEQILAEGTLYKFRTTYAYSDDTLPGRYIRLGFEANIIELGSTRGFEENDTVYALVVEDGAGFATFYDLLPSSPATGDYLSVKIASVDRGKASIVLRLPFNRYPMPEGLTQSAVRILDEHSHANQSDAYATVRILDGEAQLEELYIANLTIRQFLEENPG